MLKLVTLGLILGGLTLTGCSDPMGPQGDLGLRNQDIEQTRQPTKRQPPVQSDTTYRPQQGDQL